MNIKYCWLALLLCFFPTAQCFAVGVRNLRTDELVKTSDVIAVADVGEARPLGPAQPILFRGQLLRAEAYSSDLSVMKIIKGSVPDHVSVRYALPFSFIGYQGLHPGTRLVFLRRKRDNYALADPYYPDLPAIAAPRGSEGPQSAGSDYETATVQEMLAVVASPTASPEQKSEILRVAYALPSNEKVVTAFKQGLASTVEPELRERLQGELIRLGDVSELPDLVHMILTNTTNQGQMRWLLFIIGNRLTNRRAIPELQPLLRSEDGSVRAAAVEALWHIADSDAVPELAKALWDPDEQVRFYAVRGISDIANEPGWGGPSESEFQQHQQKYITHWQEWAKNRGTWRGCAERPVVTPVNITA